MVLSNNDGCVVARSNEAKELGVKAGTPFFQLKELFPGEEIIPFSSNYELYADITGRVMSLVRKAVPSFVRYSIDEGFCDLSGMEHLDLKKWGEELSAHIWRATRMPVSIGIAPTKTLAKMASHFAKHYKGYNHCCYIDTDEKREKALSLYDIGDVWGIGRRYSAKLESAGIKTALDFASHPSSWVRATFNNVVIMRTWRELNSEDCIVVEDMANKKSICTSRSFPKLVADIETLRTNVSNFAAKCAEKLRRQHSVAGVVTVFVGTNPFREDLLQAWESGDEQLLTPGNSTQEIVSAAHRVLKRLYRQGYQYKRAGVIVTCICSDKEVQTNFLDYDPERREKLKRLDEVMDRINREQGSETLVLGSQQYTTLRSEDKAAIEQEQTRPKVKAGVFKDSIKHDFRSPCYTTRWSDIPEVK